ncbi:MAG TPA: glycosyltransferase family 39 protein [Candidatus Acidoferrales bacterium]|nr:glycosyltransferase family 39 protein [Candidatus Acidoferrales bacterium]
MERHTPLFLMMLHQSRRARPQTTPWFRAIPAAAALVTFVVHLIANPHYGFSRDELYFVICGFRPAWGYVDQPPVVPLLAAGSQLFGHSLFLLRAIPAFFAAASVYTTCALAAELGGGAFAEIFAGLVAAVTPALMDFGGKITTDTVGLWLWPLTALYVLRIVKGADPRWWLAVGAIAGMALESKYSALFFAVAIVAGLLLAPQRRALATPWFAGGVMIATVIALPNFVWQAVHGFPMWTLLRDIDGLKNGFLSPPQYVVMQLLVTHPLLAPVWLIGLITLLRRRDARFLGIAYLLLIGLMIALHGKDYYPGNVYPIPIAAGAVTIEAWTRGRRFFWRPALAAYALVAGILLVPLLMPVLPERTMSAYDRIAESKLDREVNLARTDRRDIGNLPPDWADMHGWRELATVVAGIYRALPPAQRAQAAILASNYGEAAAIDFFGSEYGLPPVLSGHNQYWLWGTRGYSGNVLIDVHGDCDRDARLFRVHHVVARFSNPWGRPFENGFPISICEGITTPLATVWPKLRTYNQI